ncbi:MAG: hypothetical protein HYR85_18105 [Planctomycetes bacterium]|nr:hypothetical protein [Planctomycetota bacterium]MBI3843208.1 hypothetical protein [Planctomycetota bacterium]
MKTKTLSWIVGASVVILGGAVLRAAAMGEGDDQNAALLKVLSKSKLTLAQGIQQAASKSPDVAVSAKFELDNGKLSLSVYTAEKGLGGDAEHNVLEELAGSPEAEKWAPETEVFKDVEHVARSAQQLTLMSLSPLSLIDVLKKAEKDQSGTIYAITPVLRDRKPQFVVLVAAKDKTVELDYDLITGTAIKAKN